MELRIFLLESEPIRARLLSEVVAGNEATKAAGILSSLANDDAEDIIAAAQPDIFLVNSALLASEKLLLVELDKSFPNAYFVFYAPQPRIETLLDACDLRVRGFLTFNHLCTGEFGKALTIISHGGAVIEPLSAQLLLDHLRITHDAAPGEPGELQELSERENEVLAFVRLGLSNKEIAVRMGISLGTVRAHLRNIFRKLDVSSRAGAATVEGPIGKRRRLAG